LDVDDSAGAHISAEVEHSLPSWQQSPVRSCEQGKIDATSSKGEDAFISLEAWSPSSFP